MKHAHISVTLYFNEDLEEDEVNQILEECEYKFDHQWIEKTRLNGTLGL